jgi:beta-lactam-binding protein with PASTA domain
MGFFQYLKSKEFLRTVILIVVVVIILFFGLSKWMHYYTKHDQKIEVPNLEKLSTVEAQKILSDANLTFYVLDSASFNPKYPPKSVISQNPSAGNFVKEQRKIYLTLNPSTYRKITVPKVIGLTKRQVVIQLKSMGFKIGKELYVKDLGLDVVRSLEVNKRKIKPGDKLPKNTSIDLILGDGLQKRDSANIKVYK